MVDVDPPAPEATEDKDQPSHSTPSEATTSTSNINEGDEVSSRINASDDSQSEREATPSEASISVEKGSERGEATEDVDQPSHKATVGVDSPTPEASESVDQPSHKATVGVEPQLGKYAQMLQKESVRDDKKRKLKSTKSLPKPGEKIVTEGEKSGKKDSAEYYGKDAFTPEDIDREWQNFIESHGESGPDSQKIVLKQPYTVNGNTIELSLGNAFQQDILNKFHTELVGHLRKSLNNGSIELKAVISEIEREDILYTNRDKFEYFMKLKPELKTLSDKMDLDPDF